MCIVKMPLKVYMESTRFSSKPIFSWKKEKNKKKIIYFNVYGIMMFLFIETALREWNKKVNSTLPSLTSIESTVSFTISFLLPMAIGSPK